VFERHQVAKVTQVGPLGVLGLTPLGAEIPAKGLDRVDGFWVHDLTLTRASAISKDIGDHALRVPTSGAAGHQLGPASSYATPVLAGDLLVAPDQDGIVRGVATSRNAVR